MGASQAESADLLIPDVQSVGPIAPAAWDLCGQRLMRSVGLSTQAARDLTDQIAHASVEHSPEFLEYLFAIASVESRFHINALSPAGAVGTMQLTLEGAEEAALECGLPILKDAALLLPRHTNVRYASCLLRKYLRETHGSWTHALILYNGGYRQLTRFLTKGRMVDETTQYVLQVMAQRGICVAY